MDSQADAVVIGAGALGLSTALHLAKAGLGRVIVLDRFAPASQTSPRAAGLFKLIQPDETRTRLAALSVHKARGFAAEFGVELPVCASGSIMLARTEAHAAYVRQEAAQSRGWGVEVELIDAAEAHRLMPFLEPASILAAAYTPGDIYIEEPSSLLHAYLAAADRLGVLVVGTCPVTAIDLQGGAVTGVQTPRGAIEAPVVIDAAGAWARLVGRLAHASVAVAPVRHQLLITEPIAGIQEAQPILRIVDSAVYLRPSRGGLMLGGFESAPLPLDPAAADRSTLASPHHGAQAAANRTASKGQSRPASTATGQVAPTDHEFSMDDVPLDRAVLDGLAATVRRQVPAIDGAGVQEHRGGLFTMTPDGRFLAGPAPEVRGLWLATGCNGSGFSSSPAIGQALAEWIVGGEPSIDLGILSPGRFMGANMDETELQRLGAYQYAHYYDPAPQPSRA